MAQVTVQRYAAELGRLPATCICCGQPAQQMVRHKFYYDPLWLIMLGPIMGIFRYIWASQSLMMFAPVCGRHGWRLGLPTYLGYFFAFSLLLLVPVLIASSQVEALRAATGLIWLAVFLYLLGMLALLLIVRLATPRLVDFDTGSVTLGSVSLAFKAAITGQALPGHGLRSVGMADPVVPAQIAPGQGLSPQLMYGSPLRSPATSNGPLIALVGIGGGALVLVLVGSVVVGASYLNRARRNAEARRFAAEMKADLKTTLEQDRAAAEARHAQHMAEQAAKSSRTASGGSIARPKPPTSVAPIPSTTSSSTFPTSATPASTSTTSNPIVPPSPPLPPAAPPSESAPSTPDDPFGIGQQIGPPSTVSAGGIAPKPRPDLEAKAASEPIRGRFDKPDAGGEPGPDGRVEVVFDSRFRDNTFPPTSRPLTRVTDLRVGMEIWVQGTFRDWRRGTVVGIDGLRAMVHVYGWDHETDELTPIPKIRVATDAPQPADKPAPGTNPFEEPVPAKKRTWTDATGKFKIEAEFVSLAAGKVKLKRTDGKEISLPLEMLAAPDQEIARKLGEK